MYHRYTLLSTYLWYLWKTFLFWKLEWTNGQSNWPCTVKKCRHRLFMKCLSPRQWRHTTPTIPPNISNGTWKAYDLDWSCCLQTCKIDSKQCMWASKVRTRSWAFVCRYEWSYIKREGQRDWSQGENKRHVKFSSRKQVVSCCLGLQQFMQLTWSSISTDISNMQSRVFQCSDKSSRCL